jgi:hypothetical protein
MGVTGIPKVAGNFGFTIRVDDASEVRKTASRNFLVQIAPGGALQIVNASLDQGAEQRAYSVALKVIGGIEPYRWSISSGVLPDGLLLDPMSGVISGIPAKKGEFSFVVKVTDSSGTDVQDIQNFNIRVVPEIIMR